MRLTIPSRASAKGVAAIELTVWLPILLMLLAAGLFLARFFWHYTVAQKAAHDAVRFLATSTQLEMRAPPVGGGSETAVALIARKIATDEIAELNSGGVYPPQVTVSCDAFYSCSGLFVPKKVTVSIQMGVADIFFPDISYAVLNADSLVIQAAVTTNYVGN